MNTTNTRTEIVTEWTETGELVILNLANTDAYVRSNRTCEDMVESVR